MWTRLAVLAAVVGVCLAGGEVLWSAGTEQSVYNDVVMTHEGTVSTTDFMAQPYMMATYLYHGRGTPIWEWIGQHQEGVREEFYAAGLRAPTRPVLVDLIGVIYGERNNTIVIHGFEGSNNRPVWEFFVPNALNSFDGAHLMDVSEDGAFFALLYYDIHDHTSKLLILDAQTGRVHWTYATEASKTHSPRRVDCSHDGHIITFVDYTSVYQVNTDQRVLRGEILELPSTFYTHEICTNQEADFIGLGRDAISVYEWSNTQRKFTLRWETTKSTFGVCDALHLGRRGLLFAGWARTDAKQQMYERYEIYNSSKPIWTYNTRVESGAVRNYIDDVETDMLGNFIAVAAWGDTDKTNPQVLVFDAFTPTPVFTYFTPGSMYAIDVIHENDRSVIVSAAGKHSHATDRTHWGGDAFCFRITR